MLSAYILRKLDDAEKIPPAFLKDSITISYYNKANERVVDHYTSIDFDKNYNFDNEEKETNTTLYFLDQIIHSFSYSIVFAEDVNSESFRRLDSIGT